MEGSGAVFGLLLWDLLGVASRARHALLRALLLLRGARSGSTQRLPLLSAACEGGSYAIGAVQSAVSRPEDETAGTATYAFVDLVSTRINNSSRAH